MARSQQFRNTTTNEARLTIQSNFIESARINQQIQISQKRLVPVFTGSIDLDTQILSSQRQFRYQIIQDSNDCTHASILLEPIHTHIDETNDLP
jgi:hypothetical protein